MTIYTFWDNIDPQDGTAILHVASGIIRIGESGEISNREYAVLSRSHILLPGVVNSWDQAAIEFNWTRDNENPYYRYLFNKTGAVYNWRDHGYNTAVDLPPNGNRINDVTFVYDTGTLVMWDGFSWNTLAVFGPRIISTPGFPLIISGGDASSTVFIQTISAGEADTTSFAEVLLGGSA